MSIRAAINENDMVDPQFIFIDKDNFARFRDRSVNIITNSTIGTYYTGTLQSAFFNRVSIFPEKNFQPGTWNNPEKHLGTRNSGF